MAIINGAAATSVPVDECEKSQPTSSPGIYSTYSSLQKRWICGTVCFSAVFSGLSSFIYYPSLTALSREFRVSIELINLTITSYLVISGIAPSFLGDMAEQLGRRPVSLLAFTLYLAANVGLALSRTYPALLVLRCLQSAGASGTIVIAYGVIADISTPAERGSYVGTLMGFTNSAPCLGPILGGVLTQQLSWRWIFWILAMLSGGHLLWLATLLPETSRTLTGNGSQIPARAVNKPILKTLRPAVAHPTVGPRIHLTFPNPLNCLFAIFQKGTFILLLAGGVTYTVFGCLATSLSTQMIDRYHLNYLAAGLVYLPSGVGGILAALATGRILDRDYRIVTSKYGLPVDKKSINANNLIKYPIEKARLRSAFMLLVCSTASTIGYGWALERRTHIALPLILQFFSGSSQVAVFTVIGTLLTDLNPSKSATVQASYNLIRCGFGAAGIAALQACTERVGDGWTFTVYGALSFSCIPLCWWLREAGWEWRKSKVVGDERDEP